MDCAGNDRCEAVRCSDGAARRRPLKQQIVSNRCVLSLLQFALDKTDGARVCVFLSDAAASEPTTMAGGGGDGAGGGKAMHACLFALSICALCRPAQCSQGLCFC